jgi:hypothetical protein
MGVITARQLLVVAALYERLQPIHVANLQNSSRECSF